MTEDELQELIEHCPSLFHMAEKGSWESIKKQGLLSTSALLDTYGINGDERKKIEKCHRPTSVDLKQAGVIVARIRDQIPMSDGGLAKALPASISPSQWYELLNGKVFFWLTEDRLRRLLNAKAYRETPHDVIEVDTQALIKNHRDRIWLSPMNSGCTKPFPHARDVSTFQRIETYPYAKWKVKRDVGERVVELAVDYSVPDILSYTKRVTRRKGDHELSVLWEA